MPFFWIYLAERAINKPKIPEFGSDTSISSSSMLWKCKAKNLGNQNDLEVDIYDLTIFMKLIYILVADNMIFDLVQFSMYTTSPFFKHCVPIYHVCSRRIVEK